MGTIISLCSLRMANCPTKNSSEATDSAIF